MSIWVSRPIIGWEEAWHEDDQDEMHGGEVRSFAEGWSNHYPITDDTVERRASVDTAHLPQWCVPGHEDDHSSDWPCGPWLRLAVNSHEHNWFKPEEVTGRATATVVMDEASVTALRDDLTPRVTAGDET